MKYIPDLNLYGGTQARIHCSTISHFFRIQDAIYAESTVFHTLQLQFLSHAPYLLALQNTGIHLHIGVPAKGCKYILKSCDRMHKIDVFDEKGRLLNLIAAIASRHEIGWHSCDVVQLLKISYLVAVIKP